MWAKQLTSRNWRSRKIAATTPPESRGLLEITEKTQEIQQPQLGSCGYAYSCVIGVARGATGGGKLLVNVFFLLDGANFIVP